MHVKETCLFLFFAMLIGTGFIVFLSPRLNSHVQPPALGNATDEVKRIPADITGTGQATGTLSAPIARIKIPGASVDAEVLELGVAKDGVMEAPANPHDIAWYNFSAHPAQQGNVVLAGHVDYHNYGPAVLWRLRELLPGDEIVLMLQDGSSFSYQVFSLSAYDADRAPLQEIVGATQGNQVTIITCIGNFDTSRREYDKRLVVRGHLVHYAAAASSAEIPRNEE